MISDKKLPKIDLTSQIPYRPKDFMMNDEIGETLEQVHTVEEFSALLDDEILYLLILYLYNIGPNYYLTMVLRLLE